MKKFFVLVWVHRGFVQEPEIFYNKKDAKLRKEKIQSAGFNPDYDEIDIFEKSL
jgi:hypothetical protein